MEELVDEETGEAVFLDQLHRLGPVLFSLCREAGDDVGDDGDALHPGPQEVNHPAVKGCKKCLRLVC